MLVIQVEAQRVGGRQRCPQSHAVMGVLHEDSSVRTEYYEICFWPCQVAAFTVGPPLGLALVHRDYQQQEVRIAAIVSDDDALLAACESGDVYFGIAEQIGLLRESMSDEERAAVRDLSKIIVLSIQYGAEPQHAKVRKPTAKMVLHLRSRISTSTAPRTPSTHAPE